MLIISHHQVFHNTLTGPHDVNGVSSLICRNAEEMLWRIYTKQIHQFLCLDIIVFNKCLNTILIFLRTYMLMSRKISDNVKAFLLTENTFEDWICKIKRIATKLIWNIKPFCASYITNQFSQSVLVQVNNDYAFWFKTQNCFDE